MERSSYGTGRGHKDLSVWSKRSDNGKHFGRRYIIQRFANDYLMGLPCVFFDERRLPRLHVAAFFPQITRVARSHNSEEKGNGEHQHVVGALAHFPIFLNSTKNLKKDDTKKTRQCSAADFRQYYFVFSGI